MLHSPKKIAGNSTSVKQNHNAQSLAAITGNQTILNVLDIDKKTIQRVVPTWHNLQLAANTDVYHGTTEDNANNIIQNGILPVQNGFGGGQLGPGFYTYTNPQQAAIFNNHVLHFTTNGILHGQDVPHGEDWDNLPDNAIAGNDFLHTEEDPNQYKFHNGAVNLTYVDMAIIEVED